MTTKKKCITVEDDKNEYKIWRETARNQLKQKISVNFRQRAMKAVQVINATLLQLIKDTESNHLYQALYPLHPSESLNDSFQRFKLSENWLQRQVQEIWQYVDNWPGVDVSSMQRKPSSFKEYWTISDNWWNRYKAEWIGDYLFYPLLHDELFEFVVRLTANYNASSYDARITSTQRAEYEKNASQELLWFYVLQRLLCTTVSFPHARHQPLILDQSYVKSSHIAQFFAYVGEEHGVPWMIHAAFDKAKGRKRHQHRTYAQKWGQTLHKVKLEQYNQVVMKIRDEDDDDTKTDDVTDPSPTTTLPSLPPVLPSMIIDHHEPVHHHEQAKHVQAASYLNYHPLPYIPLPSVPPLPIINNHAPNGYQISRVAPPFHVHSGVAQSADEHAKETSLPCTNMPRQNESVSFDSFATTNDCAQESLFEFHGMEPFEHDHEYDFQSNYNHSPLQYI